MRKNAMQSKTMPSKDDIVKGVKEALKNNYRKSVEEASQQEIYQALALTVKEVVMDQWYNTQREMDKQDPKVVYYMSMEFLMGCALGNNLINL